MTWKIATAAALLSLLAVPAPAQPAPATTPVTVVPSIAVLRGGLAGEWRGALGYRDYRSNELFELPVQTRIEAVPDGVTEIRRSVFDEGARRAPVWIVTVSQAEGDRVTSTSYRAGRAVETQIETATVSRYAGPTDWTIVYSQTGSDDDRPAEIRVTETRSGDSMLSVKEVRPAGDASAPWRFRNQTRLSRVP